MTNTLYDQSSEEELHQSCGSRLAPLFTWRGRDVYPLFGAEGDDDGDGEPNSGSDDDDDDASGEGESGEGSESRPVTREEFDKLRNQLSASDKNRAAAEKKLKEIEDAKKDELTKVTERAEAAEKQLEKQGEEIAGLRLQNAFLSANTGITWHDPEDALEVAQKRGYLSEVVGEDGKVDGAKLTTKLKELAKAKPHLVKTSGDGKEEKEEPKTPTGQKVGSKGSNNGKKGEAEVPSRYQKYLNR